MKDNYLLQQITSNTRVCSEHFLPDDYKQPDKTGRRSLKPGAFPSQFNWAQKPQRRKILRASEPEEAVLDDIAASSVQQGSSSESSADSSLQQELDTSKSQIESLRAEVEALKMYKFGIERFSTDDASIKFYTGFPSYEHLKTAFNIFEPTASTMKFYYPGKIEVPSRPGGRSLLLIDEFFLFLVRVRLGLFVEDISDRFNISQAAVSRKVITWANYLYFFLGSQPIWPSKERVQSFMPPVFKQLYPDTRVILDCTEIKTQVPSSLLLQSQMYSNYKSCTTFKGLVGIAPNGAITFVSQLYTGSISDKEIVRVSGILDLVEEDDSIMADKGFDIEDVLESKNVKLNIPPFLSNKQQFSVAEAKQTKNIAKVRIHVERAIRRIKEFHIFDRPFPLNSQGTVNQIWTVACLLVNFQGPLILKNNPHNN